MLFNSYIFLLLFLPLVLVSYYAVRNSFKPKAALIVLIIASFGFYASWRPIYLFLLLASIASNYLISGRLENTSVRRRGWLVFGIIVNLVLLGYFKYTHFFLGIMAPELRIEAIVLPLGISFYTFQQIMFLTDIYKQGGRTYGLPYYAASVSFFPHLVAGPIVPYRELMPQFAKAWERSIPWDQAAVGLTLFALGLFKKTILADPLADPVARVFSAAARGDSLSFTDAWGGALAYTFQLYFDFSGYTDMALGLGHMFGIRLPANFLSPYKARSISEFWRRWHITLSNFLRDHLYIPLGGNRRSRFRTALNLMLTMGLGGLWHGAGWTFVVWGLMHGAYLVGHRIWLKLNCTMPIGLGWAITFLAVVLGWVMFRAESLTAALTIYHYMLFGTYSPGVLVSVTDSARIILLAAIALFTPNSIELIRSNEARKALIAPGLALSIVTATTLVVCILRLGHPSEFLYFNF